MINDRPIDEPAEARRAIDLSAPFRGSRRSKEDQVFETEHRFRFSVSFLLFPECFDRKPPVMPDDCGGAEGNLVTGLLHAPAKIHVVAGLVILVVESADAFKSPAIPGHVTTGNVFCDRVGQEDMARPTGGRGDTRLHPILGRRRNVRATHSCELSAQQGADQVIEPILVRHAVGIGVGENLPIGGGGAGITGVAETVISLPDVTDVGKTGRDLRGFIR